MAKVVSGYLFSDKGADLRWYIGNRREKLCREIANYDLDRTLKTSEEELFEKYRVEPPVLRNDVHHDPDSNPGYSASISTTIVVSFDGDGELFGWQPPLGSPTIPHGEVFGNEIHITYEDVKDPGKFKVDYERNLSEINKFLGFVKEEAENFNNSLRPLIRESIAKRKKSLLDNQNLIESIGLPIKRYDEIPKAYEIPDATKELEFEEPEATTESSNVELRRLRGNTYEDILEIICSMSLAMQRSPRVFSNLKEEEIRDFFLVFLNGHYGWEGQATGETFNGGGKTDILINYKGQNVFIAECKFWYCPSVALMNLMQQREQAFCFGQLVKELNWYSKR